MDTQTEVMLVEDLASIFKVKTSTIREWIRLGKLPAKKVGKRWYSTYSSINNLLSNKTFCPLCGNEMSPEIENVGFEQGSGPSHYTTTGKLKCPTCGHSQ